MGLSDWLSRKRTASSSLGQKRYEYPTGNVELAIRVERGERIQKVMEEILELWTPGKEHLWDEYDPESLIDTPEKQRFAVNILLFGRLTVYRALRAIDRDIRESDPFDFGEEVPEVFAQLRSRFPTIFGDEPHPGIEVELIELKLTPGDPGFKSAASPDKEV